jgi:hypothetical protein
MECIRNKNRRRKTGSDEQLLKRFVDYAQKCRRRVSGKWVNGAYVENEIIASVAHQNNIIISVAERMTAGLQVITPDGRYMALDDDNAQSSPFFLWCTGGHYQALVRLQDIQVLESALSNNSFIEGNLLNKEDIRTQ